jgi:signal transduction histidine kinase
MNDFYPDEDFLKTLTVIYVEDDAETREQLSLFLRRRVGVLVVADSGAAGLEAFRANRAHMIVTDIQMPGMDGLAMVREIRKTDGKVPIIVTTAFEQTDYFVRSIDAGVDKYVTKPVDPDKLNAAMLKLGRRLQKEQIAARVSMLLHKSQLQSMAAEVALAEERERRRIAEGLHDEVIQNLAVAAIKLDGLQLSLLADAACADVRIVRTALGDAITDLRSMTFELSPPMLYEVGLEAALKCLAAEMERTHGIQVQYADDGLEKAVGEEYRATLYRSTRELMINAVKHAQANLIEVTVTRSEDDIHIQVADNGRGFSGKSANMKGSSQGGFGLSSIRERLGKLGGSLLVDTEPGAGTRMTLVAPLLPQYKTAR